MKILNNLNDVSKNPKAITVGNFDGIHKGHQALINKTKEISSKNNVESVIFTFNELPKEIFSPDTVQRLYDNKIKESILSSYEIDTLLSIDFNEIKDYSADFFCEEILIKKLKAQYLIIGENFKFGKDRSGDIEKLRKYNSKKAFELIVPELETYNGVKISSSRIRNLLNQGDIIGARECLGRDYMLSGTVVSGEKLGRKLGYPTANIRLEYDYPLDGVYLTKTVIEEKNYVGLASLGNKPTFNGSEKLLEVFILDFDEDIYSQNIEVYFLEEIRKQIKFSNEDELIKQMNEDHKYAIINSKKYGI